MFYPLFIAMFSWTFNLCQTRGPRPGLWHGWLYGLMLPPVWIAASLVSITLDLRGGAAFAVLAAFILTPPASQGPGGVQTRFLLSDFLLGMLVAGQIASQYLANDLRLMTSFELARKWMIPYLMGRLFLGSAADITRVLQVLARPALVMSVLAVLEAFLKMNLVNKALGRTYGLLELGEGYRMGLKRAQGPMDHPIFFGVALVLLLPWGIEAARRAWHPEGRSWWLILPWAMGAALFCTVARGPQMAAIATLFIVAFLLRPRWRLPIIGIVVILAVAGFLGKELVLDALGKMAGEEEDKKLLVINGEEYEYSGTNHRILLYKVYAEYIDTAGLFGFGSRLQPVVIEDERIAELFASIDNGYLLMFLQYGYVGLLSFVGLSLCSIYYLVRVGWQCSRPEAGLAAGLGGALISVGVSMLSVWFAPDYAAVWLFSSGVAANLRLLPEVVPTAVPPATPAAPVVSRPGRRPGSHALPYRLRNRCAQEQNS